MAELYKPGFHFRSFKNSIRIFPILFFPLFLLSSRLSAQGGSDQPLKEVITDGGIQTVQFTRSGQPSSKPILMLGSQDLLSLQFDVLGSGRTRSFSFTIVHCESDWKPSNMLKSDYIEGFFSQDNTVGSSFSTSTLKKYTHYKLDFPTYSMKPKVSGNYMMIVYTDDPDKPVISRKFYVYEQAAELSGSVQRATIPEYRDTKQEVNFTVNYSNLILNDPFQDIKVVVRQNWRQDNEITDLKPKFVNDRSLVYEYQEENLFDAGNEFRPFDTRDFQFKGINVRTFIRDTVYLTKLDRDEDRSYTAYSSYVDQNGGYTITTRDGTDASTDADYTYVTFQLSPAYSDEPKDIYVFGALSNWQLDKRFKMVPNKKGIYECTVLLKQGYYDYEYAVVDKNGKTDASVFEGNHWETENDYTIFVYYHPIGSLGDRLIAVQKLNTTVR